MHGARKTPPIIHFRHNSRVAYRPDPMPFPLVLNARSASKTQGRPWPTGQEASHWVGAHARTTDCWADFYHYNTRASACGRRVQIQQIFDDTVRGK